MIRYVFRDEGPLTIPNAHRADPQKIGVALAEIAEAHAGRLTPQATVEAARDPRSPLHRHFTWDDAKAASAYRLDQARELIRIVRFVEDDEPMQRAFYSARDKQGVAYHTASDVLTSVHLQLAVLDNAERDLKAFTLRYAELTEVCLLVSEALRKARARREKLDEDRP